MAPPMHPAVAAHLPGFITAPGETDTLFIAMAIFVVLAVIGIGVFYLKLHALPEQLAHGGQKVQFQVVSVLALLGLFTHSLGFWIAALLLAMIPLPDIKTPIASITDSLQRIARNSGPAPKVSPPAPEVPAPTGDQPQRGG